MAEFRATGNPATNTLGKQFRSFCPIGPCIATNDEIPIRTTLNFRCVSTDGSYNTTMSSDIIAYYSQWLTFQPGDVISRDNPAGVGFAAPLRARESKRQTR